MSLIRIDRLFSDPTRFPWELIGMDRPLYGPPHVYLCRILSQFIQDETKGFFRGSPSLYELEKAGRDGNLLAKAIHYHCENNKHLPLATCILKYLQENNDLRDMFQANIDKLYRTGRITIPKEYLW